MGAAFLIVLVVPWLQDFFALKLVGATMPWIAVGIAAVAAAALELLWRLGGPPLPGVERLPHVDEVTALA